MSHVVHAATRVPLISQLQLRGDVQNPDFGFSKQGFSVLRHCTIMQSNYQILFLGHRDGVVTNLLDGFDVSGNLWIARCAVHCKTYHSITRIFMVTCRPKANNIEHLSRADQSYVNCHTRSSSKVHVQACESAWSWQLQA